MAFNIEVAMLERIIQYSIRHKLIIIILTLGIVGSGVYALLNIPIGAVPDITNNQVQVITTSRNLATQDVEKFLTYPVELEMANLPGVKEIRSISKFGLSVVTVVFNDDVGTYLPRQLIAEKLQNINTLYEDQIRSSAEQADATKRMAANMTSSLDNAEQMRIELEMLKTNLSELNSVYGNMLNAMNGSK